MPQRSDGCVDAGQGIHSKSSPHDALGRLVDRKVPGAPMHTVNGKTVSHHYTHNAWSHITTATHDGETILYGYDAIGRVTSQTYAGNRVVSYLLICTEILARNGLSLH